MFANHLRVVAGCVAVAVLGLGVAGCSGEGEPPASGDGSASVPLVQAGTLTICSDIPYKPFEYPDEADSERFQGYDVDTIEAIAAANHWQTTWVVTPTDSIFATLDAGGCDVIASAVEVTDARRDQVDFTTGYFDVAVALVVRTVDEGALVDLAALAGKRIGVQSDTEAERYVAAHDPGATIVRFSGDNELFAALGEGEVQAVMADLAQSANHTSEDDAIAVVATYPTGAVLGFAVKKDSDPALLDALNAGIARLGADGERDRIYRRYFPDAP